MSDEYRQSLFIKNRISPRLTDRRALLDSTWTPATLGIEFNCLVATGYRSLIARGALKDSTANASSSFTSKTV